VKPWTPLLALAIPLIALPVLAADMPYAGQQARSIKSLSDDEIAALRKGEGRGYPGPAHVLQL